MLKLVCLAIWRHLSVATRYLIEITTLLAILLGLLVLMLRYQILPEIERYHVPITQAASAALGQPLQVAQLSADWDGLRPRLILSDVQVLDQQGRVALHLPRLELTVAWFSLLAAELRLDRLEVEGPDLAVKRDATGQWYVAGIPLRVDEDDSEQGGADWLLHQNKIVIRHGRLTWDDELRHAPTLVFDEVDLRIENRWWRHRFAMQALPPARLASRLDVRGNFSGSSFSAADDWDGQLFAQMDYADVTAWRPWLALPSMFRRGKGALRLWLGMEDGRVASVDADVALAGVQARLAEELPQLDLKELRGRLGWQQTERDLELSTQQLALQMRDGFQLQPTDFYLHLSEGWGYQLPSGEIRANKIRLGGMIRMMEYLPLDAELKRQLKEAQPRGQLTALRAQWQGDMNNLPRYSLSGHFADLSMRRIGMIPGFSGLSGEVEGTESGGAFKLDSQNLKLDAPEIFAEPLNFDKFQMQLGWHHSARGWEFRVSDARLVNADLEGGGFGDFHLDPLGGGVIDAALDLSRLEVGHAARYAPLPAVGVATHAWLKAALQAGHADSFRLRLRGNLRDFPFVGGENGLFRIEAKARDVALEFAKSWPHIEDGQVKLLIDGSYLEVMADTATTAGAHLQKVKVFIPDLLAPELQLQVKGEAADETRRCLAYVKASPVRTYLHGLTDEVVAQGLGKLNLELRIPLSGEAPVKVAGNYHFADNEIDFGWGAPHISHAEGDLAFSESGIAIDEIKAQVLGGPAQLSAQSEQGVMRIKAVGHADLRHLRQLQDHPLLHRLRGGTDWNADIWLQGEQLEVQVASDLKDIASDLPQPLTKQAGVSMPLKLQLESRAPGQQKVTLSYATLLSAILLREQDEAGVWQIARGQIALGRTAAMPRSEGLYVVGGVPQLSLQGWGRLSEAPTRGGVRSEEQAASQLPDIAGIDLTVDQLVGYGNTVSELDIKGSGRNGLLSLRLQSRELSGDVVWQPQEQGRLLARLKHVMLAEGPHDAGALPPGVEVVGSVPVAGEMPVYDVAVEQLTYKGRQLGRLDLHVSGKDGDLQLDSLRLTNPDGVVAMSGKWYAAPERTQVNVNIEISDAGKILSRSGNPDSLKGGSGTLVSELRWNGAPGEVTYSKLNGDMTLNVGRGQFMKLNAGVGKLLGVLSLQYLYKRVAGDFTDVFSEGFQFENITGTVQIVNGLLLTSDLKLVGTAAKVTMNGQVDLARETQSLRVRVLPSVSDNVALLSFAAGPAVGVGVMLAQKILRDPLDKLASFEYNVSGSWADPKVERLGQAKPPPAAGDVPP